MKKTLFMLSLAMVLSIGMWVQAAPGGYARGPQMKERLITLRNWALMDELGLSGPRAQQVFDILKGFDKRREDLIRKRRLVMDNLRDLSLRQRVAQKRVDELIRRLTELNVELARLPGKETRALSAVLSPEEQVRYMLFTDRFAQRMKRVISEGRGNPGPPRPRW